MKLTKKQKAGNTISSMVGTLTSIANEYRQIFTKGTNLRGEVLGAPEDINAAKSEEQGDAFTDFIKTWADPEDKAPAPEKPAANPSPSGGGRRKR